MLLFYQNLENSMSFSAVISLPKDRGLNQGIIFIGAIAEQYQECAVYGLIITARCDIAQDKVHLYNYLPVVPFSAWMEKDFLHIIIPAIKNDLLQSVKNLLKNSGFSDSILLSATPTEIYQKLIKGYATKKTKDNFEKYLSQLQKVEGIEKEFDKGKLVAIVNEFSGIRDGLLKRLVNQNLNGYYFLENVDIGGINEGFVVLLREIQNIPRYLASKLANGFTEPEFELIIQENPHCSAKVCFHSTEYIMPISQISSPNIEHLMQCFGTTFCRIGIKDIDENLIENMKLTHFAI